MPYALQVALDHDKPSAALRAYYNLADTFCHADRYEEGANAVRDGLALARRVGNRWWELQFLGQLYPLFCLGEWDEVESMIGEIPEERWSDVRQTWPGILTMGATVNAFRGKPDDAEMLLRRCAEMESSADLQERASYHLGRANILLMAGDATHALEAAQVAFAQRETMGIAQEYAKQSFVTATEAALELDEIDKVEELLAVVEGLPPGNAPQFLQAQSSRFRARLSARQGEADEAERRFKRATGLFRELAMVFYLGVALLEYGEWLRAQGRAEDAEPMLAEAREIFERLEATPWLERMATPLAVTP